MARLEGRVITVLIEKIQRITGDYLNTTFQESVSTQ
jgi:hypothetical protein